MKKPTTLTAVVPAANIEEAWQEVGASFERFCLTAGLATLSSLMEEDAVQLCGPRYGREDGKAEHRGGRKRADGLSCSSEVLPVSRLRLLTPRSSRPGASTVTRYRALLVVAPTLTCIASAHHRLARSGLVVCRA